MLGFDAAMKGLNLLEDFHNTIPELFQFGCIFQLVRLCFGMFSGPLGNIHTHPVGQLIRYCKWHWLLTSFEY